MKLLLPLLILLATHVSAFTLGWEYDQTNGEGFRVWVVNPNGDTVLVDDIPITSRQVNATLAKGKYYIYMTTFGAINGVEFESKPSNVPHIQVNRNNKAREIP